MLSGAGAECTQRRRGVRTRRLSIPFRGAMNVIREESWLFCTTSSGVRLCWELEEPQGPNGESEAADAGAGVPRSEETPAS